MVAPVLYRVPSKDQGLIFYTGADNTSTFDPSWVFAAGGGPMTVEFGDGEVGVHATTLVHTYAAGLGRHRVRFTCPDWSKVTTLDINTDVCVLSLPSYARLVNLTSVVCHTNQFSGTLPSFSDCTLLTNFHVGGANLFSGTLPSFSACTLLSTFRCEVNNFSGVLPSFADCTLLSNFRANTNQFSGTLPSFAACTLLTVCLFQINAFSGYTAGSFATQKSLSTLRMETNQFPVASIDAILVDLVTSLAIVGRVACTVDLSGVGNAAPSNPAGLASKATLVAAGWAVTTN